MGNLFTRDRPGKAAQPAFVPGEDVLLLSVPLPPLPAAQRRAAVAFAVEDRLACPLDEVHVVLGPPLADPPGHWLVAVAGRACLQAHLARLRPAPGVRVMPDTLAVPVPPAGHWAAREAGGRVLLRMADGTGMAVPAGALPVLHAAAGAPGIVLHGGTLPEGLAPQVAPTAAGAEEQLAQIDLGSVVAGGAAAGLRGPLRRVAAVAALAGALHLSLLGAETLVLSRRVDAAGAALREALARAGLADGDDPAAILAGASAGRTAAPAGMLDMLGRSMAALAPLAGKVTLRDLGYDGTELAMTLQASDLGILLAAETALAGDGLRPDAGTATTADGLAEQRIAVRR